MGCNNSRLNANGEVVPARIRPLLLHRIEELRKNRNGATLRGEGTLSKKQLLRDDAADEEYSSQSSHEYETEDKISPKETQPAKEQTVVHVVTVEKLSKVVPLPFSECRTEEQHNKHKDHNQEKVKDVEKKAEVELKIEKVKSAVPQLENKHEEANAKHDDDDNDNDDDEEEEEEEEEEEDDSEIGRLIGPGSPSFRIYIGAEKIKEEKREKQTIAMHQKSPSADSFESAASASGNSANSNEVVEIESTTKRKGHKMKKLGAMKKNLLNVKNLQKKHHRMNPMFSCTGNDRKSLLSPK